MGLSVIRHDLSTRRVHYRDRADARRDASRARSDRQLRSGFGFLLLYPLFLILPFVFYERLGIWSFVLSGGFVLALVAVQYRLFKRAQTEDTVDE